MLFRSSAQMPLWASSQPQPRPTGSVWLKVGAAGTGLAPAMSVYNATTFSWAKKSVPLYISDWAADADIDATGGQAVPAGTIYCQYNFNTTAATINPPIYFFERATIGYTVVTGTVTSPSLTSGPYDVTVQVSLPGSSSLSDRSEEHTSELQSH